MSTKNNKIVIRENAEQATAFIAEMKDKYLSAVTSFCIALDSMKVKPTKGIFEAAIQGNFQYIDKAYKKASEQDLKMFATSEARSVVQAKFTQRMNTFKTSVQQWFSGYVGNDYSNSSHISSSFEQLLKKPNKQGSVPMNSITLVQFVTINSTGTPTITQEKEEAIRDAFRDYADSQETAIIQAQKESAKALNKFFTALWDSGMRPSAYYSAPVLARYFRFEDAKDGGVVVKALTENV